MPRAFVIRPFGIKTDESGNEIDFETVQNELIDPALDTAQLDGGTTGEIVEPGNIREDMFALILEADLVICDISVHNANVFYELGIRHALRKKRTLLIKGEPSVDAPPFDILTDRYLPYQIVKPRASVDALVEMIRSAMSSERVTDSPIFQMLPTLPEADPSQVQVVPLDFREEVGRAQAANSKGWLRLLSGEVRRQRFQWEGLKLVAAAQWDQKDYEGARKSWETVRSTHPDDVAANLALANIYERLYRIDKRPEYIKSSDQAIDRVLANHSVSRDNRAEALALQGRNAKTRWRLGFASFETRDMRRQEALNRTLIESYKAYLEAFNEDLNHFYPGLCALQVGVILLDLATGDARYDLFDSDQEADSAWERLNREVSSLKCLVPASVDTSLQRMDRNDPERMWSEISRADVLFLVDNHRVRRVISAYRDAIPRNKPFAWDAARGQLELFSDLGIQSDLASSVIRAMDDHFGAREPNKPGKPIHLILFAGHRIDLPGRSEPRFPEDQQERAKKHIRQVLESLLDDEHETVALASAAPGADILCHEICEEIGVKSTICLPMPKDAFASFAFENLDEWRERFLNLRRTHETLLLSNRDGLPKWLHGSVGSSWERGNDWVMNMALAWGADRITLLALWDGKREGDAPGGTAHMVRLAEDAGRIYIKRIDSRQFLN